MTSASTWVTGARPRTLPAAVTPIVVATALAGKDAKVDRALLALVVGLALQVGVNYANDYSDGIRGTDADRVGPKRLVAGGLATAAATKRAAFIAFLIAGVAGLALSALTSWWLLLVGALSILAAWYYTGGKSPYGYKALGEISVFVFFGLVATMGTYFVQKEEITFTSFLVAIPMGVLSCSLLAINNIRDRAKDALVGKETLAVHLGDKGSRRFFAGMLILAYIAALLVTPWAALTLLTLPLTLVLIREVIGGKSGAELIPLLAKTGQLQLLFTALLTAGILIA